MNVNNDKHLQPFDQMIGIDKSFNPYHDGQMMFRSRTLELEIDQDTSGQKIKLPIDRELEKKWIHKIVFHNDYTALSTGGASQGVTLRGRQIATQDIFGSSYLSLMHSSVNRIERIPLWQLLDFVGQTSIAANPVFFPNKVFSITPAKYDLQQSEIDIKIPVAVNNLSFLITFWYIPVDVAPNQPPEREMR